MADLVVTNRRAVAGNVSHRAAWLRFLAFAALAVYAAVQGGLAVVRGISAFDLVLLVIGIFSALVAAQVFTSIRRSRGEETVQLLPNHVLRVEDDKVVLPRSGVLADLVWPRSSTRVRVEGGDLVVEAQGQKPQRYRGREIDPAPADVVAWFNAH